MKKRAIVSAVASIALVGVLAVGFAACKESAKSIKGDEVTEDVWNTAIATYNKADSYKMVASVSVETAGKEYSVKQAVEYTITIEGEKVHYKGTTNTRVTGTPPTNQGKGETNAGKESLEFYYISDKSEIIAKNSDGKWAKMEGDAALKYTMVMSLMLRVGIPISEEFGAYEYNKDQNGYVWKGEEGSEEGAEGDKLLYVVKIKDEKMKATYVEESSENAETGASFKMTTGTVYTYGGQKVTVPEVAA